MSRFHTILISMLCVMMMAAGGLVATDTIDLSDPFGDDGDVTITTDACVDQTENLEQVRDDLDEVEDNLRSLDADVLANPTKETLHRSVDNAESKRGRLKVEMAKAQAARSSCQNKLSEACKNAYDDQLTLTERQAELENNIRELNTSIRSGQVEDTYDLERERSIALAELGQTNTDLEEAEEQLEMCDETGLTPSDIAFDDGTGNPEGVSLWELVCGTANPDADVYWFANHPETSGNNNGPADPTLALADTSPEESKTEMNFRRCWDPALVVEHLVSAGDNGVHGYSEWSHLSSERMFSAEIFLGNNPEEWAEAINALRDVEDTFTPVFGHRVNVAYDTFYMVDGPYGAPMITRGAIEAKSFQTLQFVNSEGRVVLEYKRDCGFQPVWPKQRPPANNPPTSVTPPPTTPPTSTPPPTSTTPTPPSTTTPPPSTTTPPTTTTPPPTTTSPPEELKCFDGYGNPIFNGDNCGDPDTGPDHPPVQDNDPSDVAPTPDAPTLPPPPPPVEPPSQDEIDAIDGGNAPPPELADDPPAPASDDACPEAGYQAPGTSCSGGGNGGTGSPAPPPPPAP